MGIPSVTRSEPRGGLAAEPGFLAFGAFAGFSEGAAQAEDINWSSPLPFAGRLITFFEELAGLDITAGMAESQSNHSHSDKASSSQWQAKIMPTHYNVIRLNIGDAKCQSMPMLLFHCIPSQLQLMHHRATHQCIMHRTAKRSCTNMLSHSMTPAPHQFFYMHLAVEDCFLGSGL